MKDRILRFLQNENKSYAQFADEIGVQASGISHILSGRNNPSLDFILKMLSKYPSLSSEWLLFGRGSMYKTIVQPTLFDQNTSEEANTSVQSSVEAEILNSGEANQIEEKMVNERFEKDSQMKAGQKIIEKVLFIYSDKTFSEYRPS